MREEGCTQEALLHCLLIELRPYRLNVIPIMLTEEEEIFSRIPGQVPYSAVVHQCLDQVEHVETLVCSQLSSSLLAQEDKTVGKTTTRRGSMESYSVLACVGKLNTFV
jgi:hypothetical protein